MVQTLDGIDIYYLKKILYISYDGMTDPLGQSQVIPYLKELSKEGYRITLLSVEKKQRLQMNGEKVRSLLQASGITWETLNFTSQPPIVSKLLDQSRLNRKVAALHRENDFDLVHCRSYVAAEAGYRLTKKAGIPFLFDMRGFWVDERVDGGIWNLKNPFYNFLYKVYKKKEKKYFAAATHIISLTQKGKSELINTYNIPPEKITVIPCCADLSHFDYQKISEEEKQAIRQQLDIPEETKVLSYLGSLGGWYLTGEMLEFFKVLQEEIPAVVFLMITHDKKEEIIQKAAAKNISAASIRVVPASRNEVPGFLSVSDWNIFFIKDAYSKKASSPTKQGEVMGMGIPVICNDIGDTGTIVQNSNSGIVISSFTHEAYSDIVDHLSEFIVDPKHIREEAIKNYDLRRGVERYSGVYRQLLQ